MGLIGKLGLPLFGAVMLCGIVLASHHHGYDDVNTLPPEEKRRIIRELLRAQKDIRRALLKVHYSLNGGESEGDDEDEGHWNGCYDKELAGYRSLIEEKLNSLSNGLKASHTLMDKIEERIKPGHYGSYESGYGSPEYSQEYGPGDDGYGPGDDGYGGGYGGGYKPGYGPKPRPTRPTRPPLTTTPETTSYRPTTESSYVTDDDDDYYARNRGGNRRYGRDMKLEAVEGQSVQQAPVATADKVKQPAIDSDVAEALDKLFDDKE